MDTESIKWTIIIILNTWNDRGLLQKLIECLMFWMLKYNYIMNKEDLTESWSKEDCIVREYTYRGLCHRRTGPAVLWGELYYHCKYWCLYGHFHREDGYAIYDSKSNHCEVHKHGLMRDEGYLVPYTLRRFLIRQSDPDSNVHV